MTAVNYEAIRAFLESQDDGRGAYEFHGKLPAAQQRTLFGEAKGRGKIHIDWLTGDVSHSIKVCFGADTVDTWYLNLWSGEEFRTR